MCEITDTDLKNILEYFSKNTYAAKTEDRTGAEALQKCVKLLENDYNVIIVNNEGGELSSHYPSQIPILEYENQIQNSNTARTTNTIYESIYDLAQLRDMFNKAKFARCRARFPVPVILYRGKYICRSSTLSGGPEIYGRSGLDYLFYGSDANTNSNREDLVDNAAMGDQSNPSDWQLFNKVRNQDIKLLKKLNVGSIVDLMVEKKKVKFGMNVTSSEKVDKEKRYCNFNILALPYPGCEFFKDFRDNNLNGQGLVYDWNQEQCDATISVPENSAFYNLKIDWSNYKSWDIITMTQNYLKYLLKYLQDNSTGMLIHCISGWDRTPLFISLIRLSLWADGLIHQTLDEFQILYLTITYDWLLYGHHFSDRIDKGEEILFFCFYVLKYICHDDYSLAARHKLKKNMTDKSDDVKESESVVNELLFELDFKGSNISLSSTCSSVSSKSQDPNSVWYVANEEISNGNGNLEVCGNVGPVSSPSPQGRRTSPVTVPTAAKVRKTESGASVGSWQMVTGTGSLKSSDSSMSTAVDSEDWNSDSSTLQQSRKDKLYKVREIFYQCYYTAVGCKNLKFGQEFSLGNVLGNLVQKVGLSPKP